MRKTWAMAVKRNVCVPEKKSVINGQWRKEKRKHPYPSLLLFIDSEYFGREACLPAFAAVAVTVGRWGRSGGSLSSQVMPYPLPPCLPLGRTLTIVTLP